ncbi:MAG: efflux RND transporter periplasmic adaptor subunit [Bacteroidales bacterium]
MMKSTLLIGFTVIPVFLFSCHGGGEQENASPSEQVAPGEDHSVITVTRDQFLAVGMVLGDPEAMQFEDAVRTTGYVRAMPSGRAEVSGLIPGRVRKVYHTIGDRVAQGDILFSLESNEFIQLQQEYTVALQKEKQLSVEYERQRTLFEQQVVAEKDFLRTESEYRSITATRQGLGARLQMVHVDLEQVEAGNIVPYLYIRSPIGGFITSQDLVLGHFIMPEAVLVEVVDPKMLQLYLQVFEKDLTGLQAGQKVRFYTPDQPGKVFEATLSRIGKSIDPASKTVTCMATIDPGHTSDFVNNLFVEALIITTIRETLAVPDEALVHAGENSYLLELQSEDDQELVFRVREVRPGTTRNGYTEILDQGIHQVLIKGTYDLWTEE